MPYKSPYRQIYGTQFAGNLKLPPHPMPKQKPIAILDTESYPNYWLLALKRPNTTRIQTFEIRDVNASLSGRQIKEIKAILSTNVTVGFNSVNYDLPMIRFALGGANVSALNTLSHMIVKDNLRSWQAYRQININSDHGYEHIDLMEPAPGVMVSLKKYATRLHFSTIQDLPYAPDTTLTADEMDSVLAYCGNDLDMTIALYEAIKPDLDLRSRIGAQINDDVMSKSGAQVAEAVFKSKLPNWFKADPLPEGYSFRYTAPEFITFDDEQLTNLLTIVNNHQYVLDKGGKPKLPPRLKRITLGDTIYKIGNGGLHSQESNRAIIAGDDEDIIDADVTSYYPNIIRNLGLYPQHLGDAFKQIYSDMIDTRVAAKRRVSELKATNGDPAELLKQTTTMNVNKLSLNSSFGKTASPYSPLYSPSMLIATTITGQLALLMLVERLERSGFRVVSANTDGIQAVVPRARFNEYDWVICEWEMDSGFTMEYTYFKAVYSQSVNSYFAITRDGKMKNKGNFAPTSLMKDPACSIIYEAVRQYLANGIPFADTIHSCTDVREFVIARNCTGGGMWKGEMVAKTLRWIWCVDGEPIVSAKNGNKVANSDDAMPVMRLPDCVPENINYDKYIAEAHKTMELVTNAKPA